MSIKSRLERLEKRKPDMPKMYAAFPVEYKPGCNEYELIPTDGQGETVIVTAKELATWERDNAGRVQVVKVIFISNGLEE